MLKPLLISTLLTIPWTLIGDAVPAVSQPAVQAAQAARTHEGKIVSVAEGKLVMSDNDGKNEHSHVITPTAKITLGGNSAKLTELKKGDSVTVTVSAEGVVTMVEATRSAPTT